MVYMAHGLCHYVSVCRNLQETLHQEHIHAEFLPFTSSYKHVWARDYMPIQLEKNLYLQYQYNPDYLHRYRGWIPPYKDICKDLGLNCITTDIVLDGGNVVQCGNKVIMTDKIFKENPHYTREALVDQLENLFIAELVIIPWDRYEMYGHSDGMVRWIGGNRVLLNNYAQTDPGLRKRLVEALSPHFVVEELEYNVPRFSKLSWAYLNFLRVKNRIFVPGLHAMEDPQALQQIQNFYPDCKVIQVQGCEDLARDGGVLHCVTWNVLADVPERSKEEA